MFFADTCALASSAGLQIRLVFLGRPPSHRLVSTKTTDGSCRTEAGALAERLLREPQCLLFERC